LNDADSFAVRRVTRKGACLGGPLLLPPRNGAPTASGPFFSLGVVVFFLKKKEEETAE
jgi:hypothetical protein